MRAGGAREMNALMPEEAREAGGRTAGELAARLGRLRGASEKGTARIREIMAELPRPDSER